MSYKEPESTPEKLYLSFEYNDIDFDDLFTKIADHFGKDRRINEFSLTTERIQTSGCGCHPEYSDYTVYLIVEKLAEPTDYNNTSLRTLLEHE